MRREMFMVMTCTVFVIGCDRQKTMAQLQKEIGNAEVVTIGHRVYALGREAENKTFPLKKEEAEKVSKALSVTSVEKGKFALLAPVCWLELTLADKTKIVIKFLEPNRIQRSRLGIIRLEDDAFYKAICEIISKKEGRKVDPIQDHLAFGKNPPAKS